MHVTATPRAVEVIEAMRARRSGQLTVTIGTGCCESTAPFLYEDFWPGPDQQPVGDVAGITVWAPEYLRSMYPGDDGVVLDVAEEIGESLSVETELGIRLILRGAGFDSSTESQVCAVQDGPREAVQRPVVGAIPDALRGLRMR
ncbi:MAG: hypothetical protein JWM05_795 [Acidimicrobiales bacterium]|nr:hypothetical protein [Acidimicrobiales bacterium]